MKANIVLLAAGFGSRLRPLTEKTPKPLVRIGPKCLLDWNLDLVRAAGFSSVFVNTHYLSEKVEQHLKSISDLEISVSHEPEILDTGGAIKNLENRFDEDTVVTLNSDALLGRDFPLRRIIQAHLDSRDGRVATLVVRKDPQADLYGALQIDASGRVSRFLDSPPPTELRLENSQGNLEKVMYTGVSVLSRKLLQMMPPEGQAFSLTRATFAKAFSEGELLQSRLYSGYFCDVGTPERLEQARLAIGTEYFQGKSVA